MFGVFTPGVTDILSDTPLGASEDGPAIAEGSAGGVALDVATYTTPITFTGGESHVIGGLIEANGDDIPSNGDYITDPLKTVVVDGDMVVEFVYPTDFIEVTGMPESGTITIRITGAADHNGKPVFWAVVAPGDSILDPANHLAVGHEPKIVGGEVDVVMYDPDNATTPIIFTGGNSYDTGGIIDANEDDVYTSGQDYLVNPIRTIVVDGDMILELVYPTDFMLAP